MINNPTSPPKLMHVPCEILAEKLQPNPGYVQSDVLTKTNQLGLKKGTCEE